MWIRSVFILVLVVSMCFVLHAVALDLSGTPSEARMKETRERYNKMPMERGKVMLTNPEVKFQLPSAQERMDQAYDAAEAVAMKEQNWEMLHRIQRGRARNGDANFKPLTESEELELEQEKIAKLKQEAAERGGDPLDPMEKWKTAKEPSPYELISPFDYINHHRILKKAADDYGLSFEDKEQLDVMLLEFTKRLTKAHILKQKIDDGGYLPAKEQRDMMLQFQDEQVQVHSDFFAIRAFVHGNDKAPAQGTTFAHKGLEYLWVTMNKDGNFSPDQVAKFKHELDAHQNKLNTHLENAETRWKNRRENKLSELDPSQAELADWHAEYLDIQMRIERAAQRSDF